MTNEPKTTAKGVRREDIYGRPIKVQTYEILVSTHEKIREAAKEFKVTAPELLEVLMDNTDFNVLAPKLRDVRAKKEAYREAAKSKVDPTAAELAKKIKTLTPEKLAEVQALLNK